MLGVKKEGLNEKVFGHNVIVEHIDLGFSRAVKFLHDEIEPSIFVNIEECD